MKWTVEYSADAVEFIDREDLSEQVREQIALFLKKMRGQAVINRGRSFQRNYRNHTGENSPP